MDPSLGLERQSVTDVPGLQFGINYGRLGSVEAIHRHLRELGVTHLVWSFISEQFDSLAGEALFRSMAQATPNQQVLGGRAVAELPVASTGPTGTGIVYVACQNLYPTGLYKLDDLAQPLPNWPAAFPAVTPRRVAADWHELLPMATWVAVEENCPDQPLPPEFRPTGIQRAPFRGWRHFMRVQGVEATW
jgi:hypothetical protein